MNKPHVPIASAMATNGSYAQKAAFAKSRERSKITARVGPARCGAASPERTLEQVCSILLRSRSAVRDEAAVTGCQVNVHFCTRRPSGKLKWVKIASLA
jgi:hypothetical protein